MRHRGFTLIEVVAVLALMVALLAVLGIGLRRTGMTRSLEAGQRICGGLLQSARTTAVMHGTASRLFVFADPADMDRYLRAAIVLSRALDENGVPTGYWVASLGEVFLPEGVFFVPPANGVPVIPGMFPEEPWIANLRSGQSAGSPAEIDIMGHGQAFGFFFEFSARGTFAGTGRLVVAPAGLSSGNPVFEEPVDLRGYLIRSLGSFTSLDDLSAF